MPEPSEATPEDQIRVDHAPELQRYEIRVGERLAGFARYRARPDRIFFMHTEVDREFAGRGLASTLIASALDDAEARGLEVIPICPFVRDFIKEHPERLALVPANRRTALGF